MFQALQLMIGGYIILRCIEMMCRPRDSFASEAARVVVVTAAAIGIGGCGWVMISSAIPSLTATASSPEQVVCRDPNEQISSFGTCICKPGYRLNPDNMKCEPK